jgi:hypothetical protein
MHKTEFVVDGTALLTERGAVPWQGWIPLDAEETGTSVAASVSSLLASLFLHL